MDILEYAEKRRMEVAKTFSQNPYLVIHIDVDKTLTLETCWTEEECLNAKPNIKMIEAVNELSKTDVIIIYTARQDHLILATIQWLRKHGVKYSAFSNDKRATCFYVDDKSFNPFLPGHTIMKNRTHKLWQNKEVKDEKKCSSGCGHCDPVTLDECTCGNV